MSERPRSLDVWTTGARLTRTLGRPTGPDEPRVNPCRIGLLGKLTLSSEVAALSAERYGLTTGSPYPLQGILHIPSPSPDPQSPKDASTDGPPRTETGEGAPVSWDLGKITEHLMGTYVDRIGYEYQHCPSKDERL